MPRPSYFAGRIGRTVADSEPYYDEDPHPAAGAPNVVVVLLDDTGFAQGPSGQGTAEALARAEMARQ